MKELIANGIRELRDNGWKVFAHRVWMYFFDPRKRIAKAELREWRAKTDSRETTVINGPEKSFEPGKVSVIIPIYDRVEELKESIESILNQTYENFELILVTDGSPKKTMEVVESYRKNPKVKIFHYYNNTGNAVRGRNKGIKEACGEFIAFQDSDDIAESGRLEKSVKFITKNKVSVVYGGWRASVSGERQDVNIKDGAEFLAQDFSPEQLLEKNYICQSAVLAKRDVIINVGGLKTVLEYREDHELWLRLLYFGYTFKAMPDILTKLRLHEGNNELRFKKDDQLWYYLMLKEYKRKVVLSKKIAYIIPGVAISGGIAVVLQQANRLLKKGYDVMVLSQDLNEKIEWFPEQKVPIYPIDFEYAKNNIDILIATSWSTAPSMDLMNAKRKIYFVQSDERRFYEDEKKKNLINETYQIKCEYMTEALWIQRWLKEEFGHETHYVPNGIDLNVFRPIEPIHPKGLRTRVLIEGAINVPFKGMEDAYAAVKHLGCELWIVSNNGKPKKDWQYDKFFENVPYEKMNEIYSSCDIFLKMSRVEGFFGPPMEAMACGCSVVVGKVTGYDEYIVDGENALVVEMGDIIAAKKAVQSLMENKTLREKLIQKGFETVKNWSWESSLNLLEDVINKHRK